MAIKIVHYISDFAWVVLAGSMVMMIVGFIRGEQTPDSEINEQAAYFSGVRTCDVCSNIYNINHDDTCPRCGWAAKNHVI